MPARCQAIARHGGRCPNPVVHGLAHCFMHSPELEGLRQETSRRGGRDRSAKARAKAAMPEAMSPAELAGWLSLLFTNTVSGVTSPKVALAASSVARVMLEAAREAERPQVAELQDQLDVLRALVERERGQIA